MYSLKKFGSGIHSAYNRVYNRFGYYEQMLAVEDAATGMTSKPCKYFVSTKKIYSNRFSTDAYADIFAANLKKSKVGIAQIPEYKTDKASEAELKSQNSYFINEITKYSEES